MIYYIHQVFTKDLRYDEDGNLVECEAPNASVLSQMAKKIADTNDDEIIIGKDGEIINKSEIQRQKNQSRLSRKNTEREWMRGTLHIKYFII